MHVSNTAAHSEAILRVSLPSLDGIHSLHARLKHGCPLGSNSPCQPSIIGWDSLVACTSHPSCENLHSVFITPLSHSSLHWAFDSTRLCPNDDAHLAPSCSDDFPLEHARRRGAHRPHAARLDLSPHSVCVARQLTFYFSYANLRHDRFLHRLFAESPDKSMPRVRHPLRGLDIHALCASAIDIDVLLTFNRIKSLNADHDAIVAALSSTLPNTVQVAHSAALLCSNLTCYASPSDCGRWKARSLAD
jgi:hypothetical protein